MRGGIFYSNYSNVTVICGPESVNVTGDPTRDSFTKLQGNSIPYSFPPIVSTNDACPVISTYLVTKKGGFPQGISETSPIFNEKTGKFEVYLTDLMSVGNYIF